MRYNYVDHTLAVGDLFFKLQPTHWMFEPKEKFKAAGKEQVWAPDAIYVHDRKVYAIEVQLTPLSAKQWARKWSYYNAYFKEANGYFKAAAYQSWGRSGTIVPRFIALTKQTPDTVRKGFAVPGRELMVGLKTL